MFYYACLFLFQSEQREMADILSKPIVREALSDPDVQNLVKLLRTDPDKAQRYHNELSHSSIVVNGNKALHILC